MSNQNQLHKKKLVRTDGGHLMRHDGHLVKDWIDSMTVTWTGHFVWENDQYNPEPREKSFADSLLPAPQVLNNFGMTYWEQYYHWYIESDVAMNYIWAIRLSWTDDRWYLCFQRGGRELYECEQVGTPWGTPPIGAFSFVARDEYQAAPNTIDNVEVTAVNE